MKKPTTTAAVLIAEGHAVWELEDTEEWLEACWERACKAYGRHYASPYDDFGYALDELTETRTVWRAFQADHCWDAETAQGDRQTDECSGLGYTADQAFAAKLEQELWPALPLVAL